MFNAIQYSLDHGQNDGQNIMNTEIMCTEADCIRDGFKGAHMMVKNWIW